MFETRGMASGSPYDVAVVLTNIKRLVSIYLSRLVMSTEFYVPAMEHARVLQCIVSNDVESFIPAPRPIDEMRIETYVDSEFIIGY